MSRSAASGDFIYIVSGSWNNVKQNSFHIFDVTTDTMTRSPFDLPYALIQHTVVISEEQQILYVFGGSQQTNTWLYLGLMLRKDTCTPSVLYVVTFNYTHSHLDITYAETRTIQAHTHHLHQLDTLL
eukprot:778329_1